jgi:glycosyltransferase involved in cell wall biosynthesis
LGPYLRSRLPGVARLTRWALGEFDEVVAVSDEVARQLENVGPTKPPVIPDYLPVPVNDLVELDGGAASFFEAHETLVVCAYRVHLSDDGDMYGLDLAVDAFVALAPERPRLGLALFLAVRPRWRQRRYFAALVARLHAAGLGGRTLVRFAQPLSPAFDHDVVYVRPTRSDGDAVSVREALERGVRVVASDVVARPPGTMLFESGDAASLAEAVRTALSSNNPPTYHEASANGFASAEALMRMYERLLSTGADGCRPLASAKSFG